MLTIDKEIELLENELCRKSHLEFVKRCWIKKDPFLVGRHTKEICDVLDEAMESYRNGKSYFAIVQVPPQHGKSELISNYFIPHFLGEFPEKEIILTSHKADQAYEFSQFSRDLIAENEEFHKLYPEIKLSKDAKNVKSWKISNKIGKAKYFGIVSGIAGAGADCAILDDYFRNRQDAESPIMRDKIWNEFTNGLITRRHDPSIVIILATRWHIDDIIGRCIEEMEKNKKFPQFKIVSLPAYHEDYPEGILFPELYSKEFYEEQEILLGEYGFLSLYQQTPIRKCGNNFVIDFIKIIQPEKVPLHKQIIVIDLASTEKSKSKDPDWTVCMRGFMLYIGNIPKLYITDVLRFRENAKKRNEKIKDFILKYNDSVYMETFGAYKDTYDLMKDEFTGIRRINPLILSGNKEVKAQPLEPIFEAGNVHFVDAHWNKELKLECGLFPGGKFDDQIDDMAMIYHKFKKKPRIKGRKKVY
jgi:predicted phage terminase large subunit-like protein